MVEVENENSLSLAKIDVPSSCCTTAPVSTAFSDLSKEGDDAGKRRKQIGFGHVEVRTHRRTLGDNPSVSSGVPVTLRWSILESFRMSLRSFEAEKEKEDGDAEATTSKKVRARKLSAAEREAILRNEGHTRNSFLRVQNEIRSLREGQCDHHEPHRTHKYPAPKWMSLFRRNKKKHVN
jgi:hypothetical protein